MSRLVIGVVTILGLATTALAAPPKVLDDRLKLELFAEQPQLVTPTGIDVDHLGRVWVIESNTHFPPDGYQGHPTDRVLILEDTDADGKADKVTPFADGLVHAMSVVVKPIWLDELSAKSQVPSVKTGVGDVPTLGTQHSALGPLTVFLATRKEILRLRDTDGDLKADERTTLVRLDTPGNYPHNGLAGIAFDALGWMFFGFGENLGADYKIIGSDGITLSGGGEGGNMYRCRPDGTKLERWATGFWNPHASCFDAFGRLFTVDNDPDSRPPCRLLHIIPGGDYGYRFRNGRKGTHPFTSWNGELPGTLPMVSGTGEAPSGIVCYESDGFPDDYLGTLLVGSWGDHRIDQFVLEPKGASFVSKPKPIVQGDDTFRPVGLALGPDGSVYFSDWVLRDYKLHGKGRVWRLSGKDSHLARRFDVAKFTPDPDFANVSELMEMRNLNSRRYVEYVVAQTPGGREWLNNYNNKMLSSEPKSPFRERRFRELLPLTVELPESDVPPDQQKRNREQIPMAMTAAYLTSSEKAFSLTTALRVTRDLKPDRKWWSEQCTIDMFRPTLDRFNVPLSEHALRDFEVYRCLLAREIASSDATLASNWLDQDLVLRQIAVQWIGEERLVEARPRVAALLDDQSTTPSLFLACLATLSLLDGVPAAEFEKTPPTKYLLPMLTDRSKPAALRGTALRLLPPATPELPTPLLVELLQSDDATLRLEAVRTLALASRKEAVGPLLDIAATPEANLDLRCEAILALSAVGTDHPEASRIDTLLLDGLEGRLRVRDSSEKETLQLESIRAARTRATEGTKLREALAKARETASVGSPLREAIDVALTGKSAPSDSQLSTLNAPPAPSAGRRVFFSPQGAQCAKCHTVHGRGGNVGPDLSVIARTMSREKLHDSIVNPSKEISPQYLTWAITTKSGQVHTGIVVTESGGGDLELGDAQGNILKIPRGQIDERTPSPISVMPQGLPQRMTPQEFADLLSYLETLK